MLQLEKIDAFYGEVQALRDVSFVVKQGEIVALIGSNGAGKTSTLRLISGLLRPASGRVLFESQPISRLSAERIVSIGISHVPQGRRIFPGLTVYENLRVATASWGGKNLSIVHELKRVYKMFPVLEKRKNQLGWSLSGGEQQMLAVGRALIAHPKLLLLDEPSLGLAPALVEDVFKTIREIRDEGTTLLLVEQNAAMALTVSDRGYVIENGAVVMEGTARQLMENEEVRKAYLGI